MPLQSSQDQTLSHDLLNTHNLHSIMLPSSDTKDPPDHVTRSCPAKAFSSYFRAGHDDLVNDQTGQYPL